MVGVGATNPMRCNPWRWLWGVIPIAMLTWLAFTWEREGIETDLRSRAEAALESEGYAWGEVSLDGRDAFLTGVAPDESQPYRAADTVRKVRGVRIVRSRTDAGPNVAAATSADPVPGPSPDVSELPSDRGLSDAERAELEARAAAAREHERRWKAEGEANRAKAPDAAKAQADAEAAQTAEAERVAAEEEAKQREEAAARAAEAAERARVTAEEEAKQREDEAARAAEEERARVAAEEDTKRREDEAARAAEAERARVVAEEEAKRRAEDAERERLAEEQREQAAAEAEAQRLADEQAKAEEEAAAKRKAEEEAAAVKRAEEEAEAKRRQEQDTAEARQKEAEETKRKAEADHCQGLMRSAMAEGTINFARAKADITRDSHLTLDRLAGIAKVCPQARISIAGHTDAEGEPERNQGLSERRAQAVADYLIGKGVDPSRLKTEGFGESRPLAPNDTAEGMRQNRRIEFSVAPAY